MITRGHVTSGHPISFSLSVTLSSTHWQKSVTTERKKGIYSIHKSMPHIMRACVRIALQYNCQVPSTSIIHIPC